MRKVFIAVLALIMITNSALAIVAPASTTSIVPARGNDSTTVESAVAAFKALSRKDKKARVKDVRKEIKNFKTQRRAGEDPSVSTLLLVILAILLPPLAVYLYEGEINTRFWISLLLTLLFWLPGVIYALILILGDE